MTATWIAAATERSLVLYRCLSSGCFWFAYSVQLLDQMKEALLILLLFLLLLVVLLL